MARWPRSGEERAGVIGKLDDSFNHVLALKVSTIGDTDSKISQARYD